MLFRFLFALCLVLPVFTFAQTGVDGEDAAVSEEVFAEVDSEIPDSRNNLDIFDPSQGLLFDSLFPITPERIYKRCTITVIDSTEKEVHQEKIDVVFNLKGQASTFTYFNYLDLKNSAAEIRCEYNKTTFYSVYRIGNAAAACSRYSCSHSADGRSTVASYWFLSLNSKDTMEQPSVRSWMYKSKEGRDSTVHVRAGDYNSRSILTSVKPLEDTIEVQTHKLFGVGTRDTIKCSAAVTRNHRGQLLEKEVRMKPMFEFHDYTYDANGRLSSYTQVTGSSYGDKTISYTFDRNKKGDVTQLRYKSPSAYVVYVFKWE